MPENVSVASDVLSAEVATLGAELQRLTTADGRELLWDGDPAVWSGRAPLLFPIVGALRDGRYRANGRSYALPKHGFARRSTFEIVERSPASAHLRLSADAATRAIYPFDFQLDVTVSVEDATLTLACAVGNRGEGPMPASLGFHPALRWPLPFGRARDAHRLVFAADEPDPVRRIDGDGLLLPAPQPTPVQGRELSPRDELFQADAVIFDRVRSRRVVFGAAGAPRVAVEFADADVLGVWSKPGAGFLCVEPWCGLPDPEGYDGDLFNKPGVFVVPPKGVRTIATRLTLMGEAD